MTTETDDITELLADLMDDSEFEKLMDEAKRSGNAQSVLESAYRRLMGETDPETSERDHTQQRMADHGLTVRAIIGKVPDPMTGLNQDVIVGYDLCLEAHDRTLWMGRTLSPGARHNSLPFESHVDAIRGAIVWMDLQAESNRRPPVQWRQLLLPICDGETMPSTGAQVHWKMTPDETRKMNAILRAMRATNLEVSDGKPIDSHVTALRYLIEKIYLK